MSFLFLLNFVLSKEIALCQKVISSVFRKKQRNEEIKRLRKSAVSCNSILRDYIKTLFKKWGSSVKKSIFKKFDNKNSPTCSLLLIPLEEDFWPSKSGQIKQLIFSRKWIVLIYKQVHQMARQILIFCSRNWVCFFIRMTYLCTVNVNTTFTFVKKIRIRKFSIRVLMNLLCK